jgi:hypothetical protein
MLAGIDLATPDMPGMAAPQVERASRMVDRLAGVRQL